MLAPLSQGIERGKQWRIEEQSAAKKRERMSKSAVFGGPFAASETRGPSPQPAPLLCFSSSLNHKHELTCSFVPGGKGLEKKRSKEKAEEAFEVGARS